MRTFTLYLSLLAAGVAVPLTSAHAQQLGLKQPEPSPAASISQTVGLTEIKISYHRPAVAGRKLWGDLVPYGTVWRAGANENTTITFSTAVQIGGKLLPAGTYGFQTIPNAKEWTIIFSHTSVAWGSYGYDAKEDALRVTVAAAPAESFEERLSYSFDNPTETAVVATLRWEKIKVPIKIEVDTPAVVRASMLAELRGGAQFSWLGWSQAAQYWLTHGGNIDDALRMVEKSLAMQETFPALSTRAAIADKKGDSKLATELRTKALSLASESDLNQYAYSLLAQKRTEEALVLFHKNVAAHPQSWNAHDSLAEAYLAKGDRKAAVAGYSRALSLAKDEVNRKRIEQTIARLNGK